MEKLGSPQVGGREGTLDGEALFNLLTSEWRPEGRKWGRENNPCKDPEVGASQVWSKNSMRPVSEAEWAGKSNWRGGGKGSQDRPCQPPRPLQGPHLLYTSSDQIRSVAQSCPTLCDPMNRSTPGLPVHHQLPEFTQTYVHRVSDAIQPSHPLSSPSPLAPNPSQHQSLFQ